MGRSARWTKHPPKNGVMEVKLSSWKYFSDYINQEMLDYTTYVYRGHGDSNWKLEPSLDRVIKVSTSPKRKEHLEAFKYSTRGRRGSNPPIMRHENDWWALGQHHGLYTPLLDWTESPFVALYFAATSAFTEKTKNYSMYALAQPAIDLINRKIEESEDIDLINDRKPTVKLVKPQSDENSRLVSQRGMFSRGPNNIDLETWVKEYVGLYPELINRGILMKMTIPSTGVKDCLRYLNRMNINNATLFPDLGGASEFCNKHLTITKY